MSEAFDPYHKWLAIPPAEQPPNHYRLLGVTLFESDPDVIAHAAAQRIVHVRAFQIGKHSDESQQILREISTARVWLLNADKKAIPNGLGEVLTPSAVLFDDLAAFEKQLSDCRLSLRERACFRGAKADARFSNDAEGGPMCTGGFSRQCRIPRDWPPSAA